MKAVGTPGIICIVALLVALAPGCKPALKITPVGGSFSEKGGAVGGVGDLDGDGFDDFIVAAPGAGTIRVMRGNPFVPDWEFIHAFGGTPGAGRSVSGYADINGDDVAEFLVGSTAGSGTATARDGVTGNAAILIFPENESDGIGWCISDGGDLDGDAIEDFVTGAPGFDGPGGANTGKVYAFSGAGGAEILSFIGEVAGDLLGRNCSGAPDLDGDAVPDVLVSATAHDGPGGADAGRVYALSGAGGVVLYTLDGVSAGAAFGRALSGAGDVDGDALGDFVVGETGAATVFSGATGAPIFSVAGGPSFGFSAAHAGDVNGDAVPDFIVGEPDEGIARVYSGVGGAFLEDLFFLDRTGSGGAFGFAVAGAGDVNGDGRDDVVVGAPEYTGGGGQSFGGAAFVFTVPASLF